MATATVKEASPHIRGSVEAITEILKQSKGISPVEMAKVTEKAEAAGGSLIAVDPDGDWCGTGQLHFHWPIPRKDDYMNFLETLVELRINHEVLINGIPAPRELLVNIFRTSRTIGR